MFVPFRIAIIFIPMNGNESLPVTNKVTRLKKFFSPATRKYSKTSLKIALISLPEGDWQLLVIIQSDETSKIDLR